jgi:hypothetical protein
MQFTSEMNWGPFDFLLAGAMIVVTGLLYVFASRTLHTGRQRAMAGLALGALLLLLWVEIAVGVLGSPIAGS